MHNGHASIISNADNPGRATGRDHGVAGNSEDWASHDWSYSLMLANPPPGCKRRPCCQQPEWLYFITEYPWYGREDATPHER